MDKYTIATLGSHSALDVCRGAKDEGFETIVIAESGREKIYHDYYRTRSSRINTHVNPAKAGIHKIKTQPHGSPIGVGDDNLGRSFENIGCVDEVIILDKFDQIYAVQDQLANSIFIPNRSFEAYLHFDYKKIENEFKIPMFGNKYLLKIEERGSRPNQYDLLDQANIRYPKQFSDPKKIDRLCLVKVLEKARGFERAFFLAESYEEYKKKVRESLDQKIFTEEQIRSAVIEEFVIGVQVNFNFFYSPLSNRLELLGTDTRRQTNIEGFLKIPAVYQKDVSEKVSLKYEEAGHIAVTVLESMLEQAYRMGEDFVKACRKLYPPGVIGPFALQAIMIPGPPKKDIVVIDVSPRMPGSPGIAATPYSGYLYGQSMSVGKRVAMEIRNALELGTLGKIVT